MPEHENKLDPTAELLHLASLQAQNFQANVRGLGDVLIVYDALFQLTIDIQPIFGKMINKGGSVSANVLVMLYQCMRRDLMKALIALCSGYVIDSTFHTRRIFEAMAVFIELVKKPSTLPFYVDLTTEDALKKYVKNFKVFALVKNNLSATSLMSYENLCVFVHPSILTAGNTEIQNGKHVMRFFEVRTEAAMPDLRNTILQHLSMIFNAFKDMRLAFESDQDFDKAEWDSACNNFDQKLESQVKKMVSAGLLDPLKMPDEQITDQKSSQDT